ncbi:MAG TPA: 3-hydroxyacyl-CoA dehydrogenase NAD-binding domain-containing protein [Pyrinomonadaceae bacterium]
MMGYLINRVVVIGSGTMGGGIAAHVANAGLPVYLLDIAPTELSPWEEKRDLTLQHPSVRNRIVSASLDRLKKSKPPSFFTPQTADLVTIGNLTDNFPWVAEGDWIVEAIVENLQAKRELIARIEQVRKPSSIVSSNTSGLPIGAIAAEASAEFRKHFLGTHFFNPPRYMKLLEVIPTADTDPHITEFMQTFGQDRLGKGVVICKDTPNFIGNRYGSISGATTLNYILENGYTIEEADAIMGPLIGRPRTGMFRLQDLVGLDVSSSVAENLYDLIEHDESREVLRNPKLRHLRTTQLERGRLGDKTGQGFYQKPPKGRKSDILSLDLDTLEYRAHREPEIPSIAEAMKIKSLPERLRFVLRQNDKAGALARHAIYNALAYASRRIPEITDRIVNVDRAVRWGFSHVLGPFEIWDALGVSETVVNMERQNISVASWVKEMLAAGHDTFYRRDDGRLSYYDPATQSYKTEPIDERSLDLSALKAAGRLMSASSSADLIDVGDGVLCLEFLTATFDDAAMAKLSEAIDTIETGDYAGLLIANQSTDFCTATDPGCLKHLQNALMRVRFCSKPVVTAPAGRTLGVGAVLSMVSAASVAAAETYMGAIQVGDGGCKELVRRIVSPAMKTPNTDPLPLLQQLLQIIAAKKVSTSAADAQSLGFLAASDRIIMNRDHQIALAKRVVLELADAGYSPPARGKTCYAAGRDALAALRAGLYVMRQGDFITDAEFDAIRRVAFVLCGGDISAAQWVDEQHFLDLEREAIV